MMRAWIIARELIPGLVIAGLLLAPLYGAV